MGVIMNATTYPKWSLLHLWALLTEPSKAIQGADQRRQARLLTAMLITLIGAALAISFLPRLYSAASRESVVSPIIWVTLLLLSALYLLSRTRYTQFVVGGVVVAVDFILIFAFFSNPTSANALYYLVVPIFISSIFLPISVTLLGSVALIAILAIAPGLTPQAAALTSGPIYFIGTVTIMTVVFVRFRNLLEKD